MYGNQMSKYNNARLNLLDNGSYAGANYYAQKVIALYRLSRITRGPLMITA